MLAWHTSSPEHGGNPDIPYPSPSSPHFRPNMQSPGPPYQGSLGSAMNYSERPYENQMGSHCQSNSYPSYQPPSPYRPHPVSPPAHAHQYSSHGNHQIHSGLSYGSSHQLSPYSASQSPYGSLNQDIYSSRPSMYGSSGRGIQQMKTAWGDSSNSSTDLMQYNQPSPRPSMMPPPPMHSPPHASMSTTPGPPPPHYRQMSVVSSSSHSPHSWSQSQIPSPGVLHSPRTTPSPLPSHARSPGHSQPFSPPPTAPSPHHPPPSMTPHPQVQKTAPSPPSTASAGTTPRQPLCNSPTGQVGNTDPLQSLQKMVMLDSETVESPITRASYEMAANQGNPPATSRPASYFSVEQLAGSDPGSPYPTYYNLDQNRLCTPPRTCMSTPTSSTFSSAPDSTSSNSPRSDSRTTTASADSSTVGHMNGEIPQQDSQGRRQDFETFGVADVRMTNGTHPGDASARDEVGPLSSDSENKDSQDFIHHLNSNSDIPEGDGRLELRTAFRKSPKSPRGRRHFIGQELHSDPSSLLENPLDKLQRNKTILMTAGRRNSTLQEFEITNGQPEGANEESYQNEGFPPRPVNYFNPAARWNKMSNISDNFPNLQDKNCFSEDCMAMAVSPPSKRGRRRKNMCGPDGIPTEWDLPYNVEIGIPRGARQRIPLRGRRGGRRRGSGVFPLAGTGGDSHLDMYHNENHHLSIRNQPTNGLSDLSGVNPADKDLSWQGHNVHMGPSQGLGTEYGHKDNLSMKPPGLESLPLNNSTVNSSLPQQTTNFSSDIPTDDRSRGPLIFSVTKDGNTVKLQEGPLSNSTNSQSQFYDPSLGQSQPPKKKRGRPFGSKNKPKPPGEVRQPRKRRRKSEITHEKEKLQFFKKSVVGPYVHVAGIKEKPSAVVVVNMPPKDEEKDIKLLKQKRQLQLGNVIRQKLGLGPGSTLSPLYDAVSKDKSWLCALCCKSSHYRSLGDLFGPYYLNGDLKPSTASNPSSPVPPSTNTTCDDQELVNGEEEPLDAVDPLTNSNPDSLKKVNRTKMRQTDILEQFFKPSLFRNTNMIPNPESIEELQPSICIEALTPPLSLPPPPLLPSSFSPDLLGDSREFWVHEDCALWSQGVYIIANKIYGLEDTVLEATEMVCSKCKFSGASLGCRNKGCTEQYHYLCARDKGCEMDEENFAVLCLKHKKKSKGERQESLDG